MRKQEAPALWGGRAVLLPQGRRIEDTSGTDPTTYFQICLLSDSLLGSLWSSTHFHFAKPILRLMLRHRSPGVCWVPVLNLADFEYCKVSCIILAVTPHTLLQPLCNHMEIGTTV